MNVLARNIVQIYGDFGQNWLKVLPEKLLEIAGQYDLSDLTPLQNLSYHYVCEGRQKERSIILKMGPDYLVLHREAAALQAFNGFGAVDVLAEREGALLLEKALPGISLKSYFPAHEIEAIHIASGLIKKLHEASRSCDNFPHVHDWLKVLDDPWPIPVLYLQKARQLKNHLLQTSPQSVLLHGDLHHDNILKNGDKWVIIDPKGVYGDPACEPAAFIRNPMPALLTCDNAEQLIQQRIACFAHCLQLDAHRIRDWCFVHAVLSWVWALEDHTDTTYFEQLTRIMSHG